MRRHAGPVPITVDALGRTRDRRQAAVAVEAASGVVVDTEHLGVAAQRGVVRTQPETTAARRRLHVAVAMGRGEGVVHRPDPGVEHRHHHALALRREPRGATVPNRRPGRQARALHEASRGFVGQRVGLHRRHRSETWQAPELRGLARRQAGRHHAARDRGLEAESHRPAEPATDRLLEPIALQAPGRKVGLRLPVGHDERGAAPRGRGPCRPHWPRSAQRCAHAKRVLPHRRGRRHASARRAWTATRNRGAAGRRRQGPHALPEPARRWCALPSALGRGLPEP